MRNLDQLRSTLSLLVKRRYFLDRWMGVESLLSILHNQYNLHHISAFYLNRYITNIGLNDINIFHHKEDYLFGKNHNSRTIGVKTIINGIFVDEGEDIILS